MGSDTVPLSILHFSLTGSFSMQPLRSPSAQVGVSIVTLSYIHPLSLAFPPPWRMSCPELTCAPVQVSFPMWPQALPPSQQMLIPRTSGAMLLSRAFQGLCPTWGFLPESL